MLTGDTSVLTTDQRRLFRDYMAMCAGLGVTDVGRLASTAEHTVKHLQGSKLARTITVAEEQLMAQWYASLAQGEPDFSVYATEYYLAEVWACWTVYSRGYLLDLTKPSIFPPHGILEACKPLTCVVDVGCGCGLTTAALRQLCPGAHVVGTNLGTTVQADIARVLARRFNYQVVETVAEVGRGADVVFASEYFEHFEAPVAHLEEVTAVLQPRAWLIANSFNTRSIGHFLVYNVAGRVVAGDAMGRVFNQHLRALGYEKCETRCWNNRPAFWRRVEG